MFWAKKPRRDLRRRQLDQLAFIELEIAIFVFGPMDEPVELLRRHEVGGWSNHCRHRCTFTLRLRGALSVQVARRRWANHIVPMHKAIMTPVTPSEKAKTLNCSMLAE